MMIALPNGDTVFLGETEATPTIGIADYSRRVTDNFGVTTVVKRDFSRRMSVRLAVPFGGVDALQRRLADLRATSALWVADGASEWLSVEGFYKDFSIDVASAPLSFCTLTIEGLAQTETVSDPGGDPAPEGMASSLHLLQPIAVTGSVLASSTVAEFDYPEWSTTTTYAQAARVIKTATHRIYESAAGGGLNHDPAAQTGEWIDVGPTNRWAMFDQALGTVTTSPSTMAVSLNVTAANAVALLDVTAATVRVQAPGYDRTVAVVNGSALFLDLPPTTGTVTVTVGPSNVSVGTLLVGNLVSLGVTEASPSAGITDYSRKTTDDFGAVEIVERAWSKRMSAKALIGTNAVDVVANRIASVRATPSLWIGDAGLDTLIVYGFFKDFSIERDEKVSKLSLSIEGLSKAAPLPVASVGLNPRGFYDPAALNAQGDLVQREGSTWQYINATPSSGRAPPSLPTTENAYWRIFARAGSDGTNGAPGLNGQNGQPSYFHTAYANSPTGSVDFTTGAPGSRAFIGTYSDFIPADSTNPGAYEWVAYKGPASFGLVAAGDVVVASNALVKIGASSWGGGGGFSTEGWAGGAQTSFKLDQGTFAGLNTDPATDQDYPSIDYAFHRAVGGNAFMFQNGVGLQLIGNAPDDWTYQIVYDNKVVRYLVNGTLTRQVNAPAEMILFFDAAIGAVPGNKVRDIQFSAAGRAGSDGRDGLNGGNGTPGTPGENGLTPYLHIAYSNSPDGVTDFTAGAPGGRKYLGILVDYTVADSANPALYTWSLIKGSDGLNGSNGSPGTPGQDGRPTYVHIAYSNAVDGSVDFSVDNPAGRSYVGFYVDQTLADSTNPTLYAWSLVKGADGRDGLNGSNGAAGAPGTNSFLHTAYADSADGSNNFTTGVPGARTYLGILVDQTLADSTNAASYAWSLIKGSDGLNGSNGTPGAPGANGQPTYVHIAYSNAPNGSVDFSVDDPAGRTYIGFYVDQTVGDSTNPGAYAWSLVKGADGAGANRVVLSNFAQGLRGFRPGVLEAAVTPEGGHTPAATLYTNLNLPGWFGNRNVAYAHFTSEAMAAGDYLDCFWTPGPWAGDTLQSGKGYMMEIKPGDRIYARCLGAQHRCILQLYYLGFNAAGSLVEAASWNGARDGGGQNGIPTNFNEIGGLFDVAHSEAAFAILMFRMIGTGAGDPYFFFDEPAMGIVPKSQTTLPPYSVGPNDPLADITALNQAFMTQPDPLVIQADYQGNQVPGQFPIQIGIVRRVGGVNVSPSTLYNVGFAGNVAGSINNVAGSADRGLLTITGGTAGTVTVTSGYNESYMTVQFAVSTNYAAAPVSGGTTPPAGGGGTGGGPSTVSTFIPPSTDTAYVLMATLSGVTVGSAGSVMVATSLSFAQQLRRTLAVSTFLNVRITRSVNGGTEAEAATQRSQEPAAKYLEGNEPGNPNGGTVQSDIGTLTLSFTDSGIPAGASVVYKIYGLADLPANGVNNVQGTFAATPN